MGNKLYMEAIRALPKDWIHDGTRLTMQPDGSAVCVNREFPPMLFKAGSWNVIDFPELKGIILKGGSCDHER